MVERLTILGNFQEAASANVDPSTVSSREFFQSTHKISEQPLKLDTMLICESSPLNNPLTFTVLSAIKFDLLKAPLKRK